MKGQRYYAKDVGKYIGVYKERSCRNIVEVYWKDMMYFDDCYYGRHMICTPYGKPTIIEWV